jgi:hypothetical protein
MTIFFHKYPPPLPFSCAKTRCVAGSNICFSRTRRIVARDRYRGSPKTNWGARITARSTSSRAQPGLTISDLLALLGITKQSLGRVVKELEARDYLTTRPGNRDRRQKELRLTDAGRAAESAIFTTLRDAMSRAYTHAGQQAVTGFWQVSEALVPPRERAPDRDARKGRS